MANEVRTTVEVVIYDTLSNGQAFDLTKAISQLIDEHVGNVGHNVKAVAPLDQTWTEISHGRTVR